MTVLECGCKINLGLKVGAKRPDGYHNLKSIFLPLHNPGDTLTIISADAPGLEIISDPPIEGENILTKTWKAFYKFTSIALPLRVYLKKRVPMGAGLGGGSANAAAFLLWLNKICNNPLNKAALQSVALDLGSDVPFFLYNQPAMIEGKGEKITPVNFNIDVFYVVLVWPEIHVPTSAAFAELDKIRSPAFENCLTNRMTGNKNSFPVYIRDFADICLDNDLEEPVLGLFPEIGCPGQKFPEAVASGMSGSGSTCYGIFKSRDLALSAYSRLSALYKFTFYAPCHIKHKDI